MFDFQAHLDEVVDAVRSRDFSRFERCQALPLAVMALEGIAVMTRRDELRRSFEAYLLNLDRLSVTDYVRTASAIHTLGPGHAIGVYQTHLLRSGVRMVAPYATTITLREAEGRWRTTSLATAVPGAVHRFRPPPFPAEDASPPNGGGSEGDPAPGPPDGGGPSLDGRASAGVPLALGEAARLLAMPPATPHPGPEGRV